MKNNSVIFIENGLNINIPGLQDRCSSLFPFWGNYKFIDFHISQLESFTEKIFILDKKYYDSYNKLRTKFYDIDINLVQLQDSAEEFLQILDSMETGKILITSLSYIALYNIKDILELLDKPVKNITKISIDNTPVDMFIVNKRTFAELISKNISQARWKDDFFTYLFKEILHSNFDTIKNIKGNFIFSNNLNQLYKSNLWLIRNMKNSYILNALRKIQNIDIENNNSTVTKYGNVKNSLISSGVEINGYVENSIIFPGVVIKRNSKIINSVIMNNSRIGSKSVIKNTLVLPFYKEFMKNINTIEDKAEIGSDNSISISNSEFPDHIYNGLTVIGIDTIIGKEFLIKPGSYVLGNITLKNMENKKIIGEGSFISKKESF
jgi:ADP-glucose pyrophosphorylase